eukprot:5418627-Amphidinium_carterae.1
MVRVEVKDRIQVVNQSKIRKNHDPWHDVQLPRQLLDAQAEDQSLPFMDLDVPDDQPVETSNLASASELSKCLEDLEKIIRDMLFGAYTKQGCSRACSKWPAVLKAIHRLAKTRPQQEPYLAAQLNLSSGMSVHRDKSNSGPSWTISFGSFKRGGRLWIEDGNPGSSGLVVPPTPIEN